MMRTLRWLALALMLPTTSLAQDVPVRKVVICSISIDYLRPRAEQGDASEQYCLGSVYENGRGVPQDYAKAVTWYRKAAEQGYSPAQFYLGFMYAEGKGVPQDYAEATTLYRKAAQQGNANAQFYLGIMYAEGKGVPQDDATAYMWLSLAAAKGSPKARQDRDTTAARMQPDDVLEAQRRSRVCLASKYKDCD